MVRLSVLALFGFAKRHRWSLTLSVLSLVCFVRLGSEMREGELDALDAGVARMVFAFHGTFDGVMFALTRLGTGLSLAVLSALVCARLVSSGRKREALFLVVSAGGAGLLNGVLKLAFHRARPGAMFLYLVPAPSSFSFPSGHAMGSMAVFASIAVLVCVSGASRALRFLAVAVAIGLVLGVGVSRIYLGVHFPSDIIGGQLAGAAWVSAITGWFYPWLLPGEGSRVKAGTGSAIPRAP
jgi:undecaprenyl-diphosphatase